MRDYLEALAIPNLFDESRIPVFLQTYNSSVYQALTLPEVREIQRKLINAGFAYWHEDERGYALYESTRNLMLRYLQTARKEVWMDLQKTALSLYISWAQKYSRNRERWQKEADYHQNQIELLGH